MVSTVEGGNRIGEDPGLKPQVPGSHVETSSPDRRGMHRGCYSSAACPTLGRYAEARAQLQEALPIALDLQQPFQILLLLAVIADWVLQIGHRDHGIELLTVVLQHPAGGYELSRRADQTLARFRAVVAPAAYAEAEERGRTLDLDAAILLAHQVLVLGERAPDHPHAAPLPAPAALPERDALTGRESEILHLIAAGFSNQAIATRLVLSLSTVKWYTNQIYSKLGVHSRTQALARARSLGLLP